MSDAANTDNSQAFDAWFDAFLDDYLKRRPVSATFMGAHQYDHALPDFSRDADADLAASARELISRLDAIPNEGLSEAQIYDRILTRGFLETQLWEVGSPFFQAGNPSHHTGEAAFSVISLFQRDTEPLTDRVESAIRRMSAMPAFFETARERVIHAPLALDRARHPGSRRGSGVFHDRHPDSGRRARHRSARIPEAGEGGGAGVQGACRLVT